MARYLITGGAGFIGSHLCEHFLNQGHEVMCMDNYSTGAKENIGQFRKNPAFSLYRSQREPLYRSARTARLTSCISPRRQARWIIWSCRFRP